MNTRIYEYANIQKHKNTNIEIFEYENTGIREYGNMGAHGIWELWVFLHMHVYIYNIRWYDTLYAVPNFCFIISEYYEKWKYLCWNIKIV